MEIHIKKGLDALQTETVLRLLSQTVWACNRKKQLWSHGNTLSAMEPIPPTENKSDLQE